MANAPVNSHQIADSEIQSRIDGRQEAEALLDFRDKSGCQTYNQAFALAMRNFADSVLGPPETSLRTMSDREASVFERTRIPFGQHKDLQYAEVPIEYLAWVADQASILAAYLRSDRGVRRLRFLEESV